MKTESEHLYLDTNLRKAFFALDFLNGLAIGAGVGFTIAM